MNRLLPPGSVVMLEVNKEAKRLMIISRLAKAKEDDDLSDYCACTLPIGFRDARELVFFNHDEIKLLVFVGLQDAEELAYSIGVMKYKECNPT